LVLKLACLTKERKNRRGSFFPISKIKGYVKCLFYFSNTLQCEEAIGMLDAKIFDFNNHIKDLKIGYNKEENNIKVEYTDHSKHIHYNPVFNISIQMSQEDQSAHRLSDEDIERKIKESLQLTLDNALKEQAQKMIQYFAAYNPGAIIVGASGVVISNLEHILSYGVGTPLPSGDFVAELPRAILTGTDPSAITFVDEK
jgi:hypothetical protein